MYETKIGHLAFDNASSNFKGTHCLATKVITILTRWNRKEIKSVVRFNIKRKRLETPMVYMTIAKLDNQYRQMQ